MTATGCFPPSKPIWNQYSVHKVTWGLSGTDHHHQILQYLFSLPWYLWWCSDDGFDSPSKTLSSRGNYGYLSQWSLQDFYLSTILFVSDGSSSNAVRVPIDACPFLASPFVHQPVAVFIITSILLSSAAAILPLLLCAHFSTMYGLGSKEKWKIVYWVPSLLFKHTVFNSYPCLL